jgi:hypothetical protein
METRLKPRELRCAKQSQQSSIEFGEKGSLRRCGQLHSRHQPRAKRSINGSKSFNRATTLDVDSRSGYHGFGASAIPALFASWQLNTRSVLAVLLLWMIVLFAGFSLMAPANATTFASLVICALSVSAAIFLILELDQPFSGIMMIQSEPLRNALPALNP